jgi:hypothetical protein
MNSALNTYQYNNPVLQKINDFIWQIGLELYPAIIDANTFLPGILITNGKLFVDEQKLISPGDILHEAGHLAILPSEIRKTLTDTVVYNEKNQAGEEMGAIAWSWAALTHLNLAPEVLFHPQGYNGGSINLIENFSMKQYIGVPILQWKGLTKEPKNGVKNDAQTFPNMIQWIVK